jgi:hypothetical protein
VSNSESGDERAPETRGSETERHRSGARQRQLGAVRRRLRAVRLALDARRQVIRRLAAVQQAAKLTPGDARTLAAAIRDEERLAADQFLLRYYACELLAGNDPGGGGIDGSRRRRKALGS